MTRLSPSVLHALLSRPRYAAGGFALPDMGIAASSPTANLATDGWAQSMLKTGAPASLVQSMTGWTPEINGQLVYQAPPRPQYADGGSTPMVDDYGRVVGAIPTPPPEVPREYMAEAIRAYMVDPNYLKTVAPKTAAAIRDAVNANPRLNHAIQFNAGGLGLPAADDPSRPSMARGGAISPAILHALAQRPHFDDGGDAGGGDNGNNGGSSSDSGMGGSVGGGLGAGGFGMGANGTSDAGMGSSVGGGLGSGGFSSGMSGVGGSVGSSESSAGSMSSAVSAGGAGLGAGTSVGDAMGAASDASAGGFSQSGGGYATSNAGLSTGINSAAANSASPSIGSGGFSNTSGFSNNSASSGYGGYGGGSYSTGPSNANTSNSDNAGYGGYGGGSYGTGPSNSDNTAGAMAGAAADSAMSGSPMGPANGFSNDTSFGPSSGSFATTNAFSAPGSMPGSYGAPSANGFGGQIGTAGDGYGASPGLGGYGSYSAYGAGPAASPEGFGDLSGASPNTQAFGAFGANGVGQGFASNPNSLGQGGYDDSGIGDSAVNVANASVPSDAGVPSFGGPLSSDQAASLSDQADEGYNPSFASFGPMPPARPSDDMLGFDSSYLGKMHAIEAGVNPDGSYVTNSFGYYGPAQFGQDTWGDVAKAHPDLGLPTNMHNATPDQYSAAEQALTNDNVTALQRAGLPVNNVTAYMAHQMGLTGAMTALNAGEGASLAEAGISPSMAAANPAIYSGAKTVGDVEANIAARMARASPAPSAAPATGDAFAAGFTTNPTPPANVGPQSQNDTAPASGFSLSSLSPIGSAAAAEAPAQPSQSLASLANPATFAMPGSVSSNYTGERTPTGVASAEGQFGQGIDTSAAPSAASQGMISADASPYAAPGFTDRTTMFGPPPGQFDNFNPTPSNYSTLSTAPAAPSDPYGTLSLTGLYGAPQVPGLSPDQRTMAMGVPGSLDYAGPNADVANSLMTQPSALKMAGLSPTDNTNPAWSSGVVSDTPSTPRAASNGAGIGSDSAATGDEGGLAPDANLSMNPTIAHLVGTGIASAALGPIGGIANAVADHYGYGIGSGINAALSHPGTNPTAAGSNNGNTGAATTASYLASLPQPPTWISAPEASAPPAASPITVPQPPAQTAHNQHPITPIYTHYHIPGGSQHLYNPMQDPIVLHALGLA